MNTFEFIRESNRIEGITRNPTDMEVGISDWFLGLSLITIPDLETIVKVFEPDAELRDRRGLNVVVGNHQPPPGGPLIRLELDQLLKKCVRARGPRDPSPFKVHAAYETLHPFTDGNGRSGRLLWAWQMPSFQLGFLHTWYYQSLDEFRP